MDLDITYLTQQQHNAVVGHTIDYHHSIPSTMPLAHQLATQAATRSGTLVVADEQTAGRGRLDRRWEAPPGQALLVSIILKPPLPISPAFLPILAGVAAADALESLSPLLRGHVGCKWPNDLLLGNNMQDAGKTAGILVESAFGQDALTYAVMGIGINVNQTLATLPLAQPGAPPPTSLRTYTGQSLARTTVLLALCQALSELLRTPATDQILWSAWRRRLWTLGQMVAVRERGAEDAIFSGRAVDVTPDGALIVEDASGVQRSFSAGDVTLRGV